MQVDLSVWLEKGKAIDICQNSLRQCFVEFRDSSVKAGTVRDLYHYNITHLTLFSLYASLLPEKPCKHH